MPSLSRPPRRDASDNRAAIVAAARTLLRRDPDSSLESIAAEAGLSRRTVYGHFASRDALVATVFESGAARIAAALATVVAEDPADEVALIGVRMWREVESIRVNARLALLSPFREAIAGALEPVRSQLRATVARGIDSGRFRGDIDAAALARLIERAAVAVLDEAAESELADADAERLVMVNGLAVAGFSWREAGEIAERITAETGARA